MQTLFFGTSAFAVPSLRAVAERTQLAGVVTQPDRPAGRGRRLRPTPVKLAALDLGAPVYEPLSLREFATSLAGERYDLFALAAYGRILPQSLLDLPRLGALNVHPSLLPRYRGATPIQSALRDGATQTGVSIMLMDAGTDTGDIVLAESTAIGAEETYGELHDRLAALGARLLGRAIDAAGGEGFAAVPQTGEPTVTRLPAKEDLTIDWSWPAQRIANLTRAFSPQPAARARLAGMTVKLLRAACADGHAGAPPGTILGTRDDALLVACGDGAVAVTALVAPNRGPATGRAFAQSLAAAR